MNELNVSNIVSIVAVMVSLVAVIVGPIVSFKVAKRQIVSPIRQKWIDELREIISEYLSESKNLIVLGEDGMLNKEVMKEDIFKKLLYLQQKLNLMLNPNEPKHIELLELIESITDEIHHGVNNYIEFGGKLRGATEISQKILKEEWVRVKEGNI